METYQDVSISGTKKRLHRVNYVVAMSFCNKCGEQTRVMNALQHYFNGLNGGGGNALSDFCFWATSNPINRSTTFIVPCTYPMTSGGRRGAITDLLTTSRHPFRSFDTLRDSAARRQVQSLIFSSHRFLWPPLLLPPLTVPCMIVFERPEDLETWPYHFSFLLLTVVSKSSYGPMARSILLRTSTFVMCSVYDMLRSLR